LKSLDRRKFPVPTSRSDKPSFPVSDATGFLTGVTVFGGRSWRQRDGDTRDLFHIPLGRLPNLIYIDVMASLLIACSFSDDLFTDGASLGMFSWAPEKCMMRPVKSDVRGFMT
jgi:hypothetical protein